MNVNVLKNIFEPYYCINLKNYPSKFAKNIIYLSSFDSQYMAGLQSLSFFQCISLYNSDYNRKVNAIYD